MLSSEGHEIFVHESFNHRIREPNRHAAVVLSTGIQGSRVGLVNFASDVNRVLAAGLFARPFGSSTTPSAGIQRKGVESYLYSERTLRIRTSSEPSAGISRDRA